MHNKTFNKKHLKFLYDKSDEHQEMVQQWRDMGDWERALYYQTKMEAIVELMESIQCFHVGLGANAVQHLPSVQQRLYSFKDIV